MPRSGPPAHPNETAWVPNRADKHNSQQKLINQQPVDGVCEKCHDVITWKKQYGKYKPLRQPGKCVGCQQRRVNMPYHQLCRECTDARRCCAKCMQPNAGGGGASEQHAAAAPAPKLTPFERSMQAAPGERGVRRPVDQKARAAAHTRAPPSEGTATSSGAKATKGFDELCEEALEDGWLTPGEHDRLTDLLATGAADERALCEQLAQQQPAAAETA